MSGMRSREAPADPRRPALNAKWIEVRAILFNELSSASRLEGPRLELHARSGSVRATWTATGLLASPKYTDR
jgi:hypothetical protein